MNWFIFLSVIFVFCFQEGQCCLKRRSTDDVCECPNFLDLSKTDEDKNNVLFTEGTGCDRNATCGTDYFTYLRSLFNVSEITPPDDIDIEFNIAYIQTTEKTRYWEDPTGPPVDLFLYFGIICENNKWYATKYPVGIQYNTIDGPLKYFGGPEEFNGKKSEIIVFTCEPLA